MSLSVFNHYFHIECTPPSCPQLGHHAHTFAWMCSPSCACTYTWSWQSARHYWSAVRWGHGRMTAVTESPLPPTQQGIKDKQTCGYRKRRWNDVCVTVGVVRCPHSFPRGERTELQFFFFFSSHALLVHQCSTGKPFRSFRIQNKFYCSFIATTIPNKTWGCIAVPLLHVLAHVHTLKFPLFTRCGQSLADWAAQHICYAVTKWQMVFTPVK